MFWQSAFRQSCRSAVFSSTRTDLRYKQLHSSFSPQVADQLLPVILAILLFARRDADTPDQLTGDDSLFEVRDFQSKGKGAVASRDIARGEIIISETPLCVWPQDLQAKQAQSLLDALGPKARELFKSLANSQPVDSNLDPVLGVRATNAFNVQLPPVPADTASTLPLARFAVTRDPSHASFLFPHIARSECSRIAPHAMKDSETLSVNHSCLPNAE